MSGSITTDYTVWCAKCPKWYSSVMTPKSEAIKEFKMVGWKNKRGVGWTCPDCVKEGKQS